MSGRRWMWMALALVIALGITELPGIGALAATYYPGGQLGYDISYPNGTTYPPAPYAFGIVGITGGRAFTDNNYLSGQYAWAERANTNTPPSLYMNLNAPIGSTASRGQSGPYGTSCKKTQACYAENYGWNAAANAVTYATSQMVSSSMWWLDIETSNSWATNTGMNRNVITGAMAYLSGTSVNGQTSGMAATVGIYSTASMWNKITGSWNTLNVPAWVAGGSAANPSSSCSPTSFTGGSVWLVQYPNNGFDGDYACP